MVRQPTSRAPKVLVVGRDAEVHRAIHAFIVHHYDVHHAYFSRLALSLVAKQRFDLVITSTELPGSSCEQIALALRSQPDGAGIPLIGLLPQQARKEESARASSRGFDAFVILPMTKEKLLTALRQAASTRSEKAIASLVNALAA